MSSALDRAVKHFKQAIQEAGSNKTRPFDTQAEVVRVEDGVAWVHMPGGVDETPVQLTVNAKKGDNVQVRVAGGRAWLVGNGSSPPTDDTRAIQADDKASSAVENANIAKMAAGQAEEAAAQAVESAEEARRTTDEINAYAETAGKTVTQILDDGEKAGTAAQQAKSAADTAVSNLSQVQEVLEVVEWVAKHGTYTKATTFNPNATYYTVTATEVTEPSNADVDSHGVLIYYEEDNGIYVRTEDETVDDQKTYYRVTGTPVAEPKQEYLSQYYTLAVTEAMADYIQSHLMLTNDGLYVMKDGSGYKLRLTDYGSYIIAPDGTTIVNQNTADGNILRALDGTVIAHLGYGEGQAESGTAEAPYFTFGKRRDNSIIGNYSVAEGTGATASGAFSHAEGTECTASGSRAHAEGNETTASNSASHAEGNHTIASGEQSHAAGNETIAAYESQTAIGAYNDNQNNTAFEIGNGTDNNARSNAFTVDWDGNVKAQGWAGFVQMYAGATAPSGWLFCDGSEVAVADYPLLYAVIGNTYGTPSDANHFVLPDFMGRTPVGAGQGTGLSNRTRGQKVGAETHKLTVNEMPSHRHKQVDTPWFQSGRVMSSGAYTLADVKTSNIYTEYAGGGQSHNNMQPSLGINFIICTGETS